ncbi:slit homolog 3 protein-like [Strongylocentrotus purpuratus]|uniref:TIR domain-containing protein n=1 Tax=Strongylocentrotus purpuratus TaxID=7668 RepID=A0A7M7HFM1_STRPU|nr:slit homolog 3 protein-like [Strongylocentrotus purpuratus]|eukprot:XP_011664890.1 PREDICTED: slit homolog 3 protein-like [Strongylocentrotus purpuratus]
MMAVYAHAISFVVLCGFTLLYGVVMDHTSITLNHTCSENSSDHSANCSYRGLTSVPRNLSHDLRSFYVSHNNISMLLDKSFVNYKQLKTLDASYNSIYLIENETFHALLLLKVLRLHRNSINVLPISLLEKNVHLSSIILHHNILEGIPHIVGNNLQTTQFAEDGENACGCKNMSRFDLSFNKVGSLEQGDFVALRNCSFDRFNLNNNDIKSLSRAVFTDLQAVHLLINYISLAEFYADSFLGNKAIVKVTIICSGIRSIVPMNTSEMPRDLFPGITKLYLSRNELITIPKYALDGFEKLQLLDISSNRLSSLQNESFCGLKSLVNLDLSANKIKSLPRGSFACAEKLEIINLSRNDIAVLDPRWFDGSHSLSTLAFYQSNIHEIKTIPWNSTNLQTLNLISNKLNSVTKNTFVGLKNLKFLDISMNNPLEISVDAFEETISLKKIIMQNLSKFTMTGSFRNMHQLVFLDMSYLRSRLEITSCGQFSHTSALRTLNLSKTNIKAEDLVQFKSNRSLFSGLVSLYTLKLQHNLFDDFHQVANAFTTLWNLRELDLFECRIQQINSGIFGNLTSLTYLSLAANHIRIIPEKAFQDLQNLRVLKLNSNSITVIEKQLFSRTHSLQNLYLQDNQISTIEPFTLIPQSLKVLIIAKNPFTCTCQLAWFSKWLDKGNTKIDLRNETRCSSTSFKLLRDQTIWSFHPKDYCGVNIYLIVGVSLAIVTVFSLSVLAYQKRWWLNHKLFLLKLAIIGYEEIIENQGPEDYEYQLNLMFREEDEWWTNDCMKPFLQGRMPHLEHVVFGDNDLHPGSFYLNAIYDVIENSYKTVLLLNNESVEDTWFMTKLRMAVEHMNDTKLEKIILIFLEDIDDDHLPYLVRLLLSRNKPYLLWVDDDEDGQELFWAKFEKSMRTNREMNNVIPV